MLSIQCFTDGIDKSSLVVLDGDSYPFITAMEFGDEKRMSSFLTCYFLHVVFI